MKKYEVEFSCGQSRNVIHNGEMDACNYMLAAVTDADGDEQELYAEVAVSKMYEDTDDYDEADFDERTYPMLVDEIIRQAAAFGISRDELRFYYDEED